MASFFPRNTIELHLVEDRKAFRRLSFSLVEMALATGVVLRLFRSVALTHGSNSWLSHVAAPSRWGSHPPLRHGHPALPRPTTSPLPLDAAAHPLLLQLVEVAGGEMATSYLLIWVGREPQGTGRAEFHDLGGDGVERAVDARIDRLCVGAAPRRHRVAGATHDRGQRPP